MSFLDDLAAFFTGPPGDPGAIRGIATTLDRIRGEASGTRTHLDAAVEHLTAQWTGSASDRFRGIWFDGSPTGQESATQSFAGLEGALLELSSKLRDYADKLEKAQDEHWIQLGILAGMLIVDAVQLGADPATDTATAVMVAGDVAGGITLDVVIDVSVDILATGFKTAFIDVVSQEGANLFVAVSGDTQSGHSMNWSVDGTEVLWSGIGGAVGGGFSKVLGSLSGLGADNVAVDVAGQGLGGFSTSVVEQMSANGWNAGRVNWADAEAAGIQCATAAGVTHAGDSGLDRLGERVFSDRAYTDPSFDVAGTQRSLVARLDEEGWGASDLASRDARFDGEIRAHAADASQARAEAESTFQDTMHAWNTEHPRPADRADQPAWKAEHSAAADAARADRDAAIQRADVRQAAADRATGEARTKELGGVRALYADIAGHDAGVRAADRDLDRMSQASVNQAGAEKSLWRSEHRQPDNPEGKRFAEWQSQRSAAYARADAAHGQRLADLQAAHDAAVARADEPLRAAIAKAAGQGYTDRLHEQREAAFSLHRLLEAGGDTAAESAQKPPGGDAAERRLERELSQLVAQAGTVTASLNSVQGELAGVR
ncbi:MAG TPA: WXG100 family type VII secretion target [Candidatus Dormibacteraeota bacterium]|nr:WXG100 family type VII secretion target [Candidatus Dormibacteraeota bacterium]